MPTTKHMFKNTKSGVLFVWFVLHTTWFDLKKSSSGIYKVKNKTKTKYKNYAKFWNHLNEAILTIVSHCQ